MHTVFHLLGSLIMLSPLGIIVLVICAVTAGRDRRGADGQKPPGKSSRRGMSRSEKVAVLTPLVLGVAAAVYSIIMSFMADGSDCTFDNFDCQANSYFFGALAILPLTFIVGALVFGVVLVRRRRRAEPSSR